MDDPTVEWSKERYDECKTKLTPFLKQCGYKKDDVTFIPISGLKGHNIKDPVDTTAVPAAAWHDGKTLISTLDSLKKVQRSTDGPVRIPVFDRFKDGGINVMGKLESGQLIVGDKVVVMPNKATAKVTQIVSDEEETDSAVAGENLRIVLSGIDENAISVGHCICSPDNLISMYHTFEAQVVVMELLEHRPLFTVGYEFVMHLAALQCECTIDGINAIIDKKTGKKLAKTQPFVRANSIVFATITTKETVCVELFEKFPALGRFTLRDEGKTIAIGKVTKFEA